MTTAIALPTSERILDAAASAFGARGYEATSLDSIAAELGVTKQTILYWFPSKEALLAAVVDKAAADLASAVEAELARATPGWGELEAVVRAVFRLASRRPQLLRLLRELTRLGPPASVQLTAALEPLVQRASAYLETEMAAGRLRQLEPRLMLFTAYSAVVGVATEVEVLRALGEEPTLRSLVRRQRELIAFLRTALVP